MNLKYRRTNYKYGLRKKQLRTLKQGGLTLLAICFLGGSYGNLFTPVNSDSPLLSPLPVYATESPDPAPDTQTVKEVKPVVEEGRKDVQSREGREEIIELIRNAFPEDPNVAVAIAMGESSLDPTRTHKDYKECSIGLFQINLAKGDCAGKKIHWDKVPGETAEEKIAWLQIPENNIKIARQIYDAQGWVPWTVFTSAIYKKFL